MASSGAAAKILGGWGFGVFQTYSSGRPIGLSTTVTQPIFAGRRAAFVSTYDGWRGATAKGSFDPQTDRFFQPASFFGPQPAVGIGNVTRYNPRLREFANLSENVSIIKSFPVGERLRIDFRCEAFNLFNRVRFGTGSNQLQNPNFGKLTGTNDILNDPRRVQLALKLAF
jgi:hypothetical protein